MSRSEKIIVSLNIDRKKMKTKIIAAVFFILCVMGSKTLAGGHDSLLFDGAGEVRIIQSNFNDDCNIKVTKVSGFVVGTRVVKDIYSTCGVFDTTTRIESAAQLKEGNMIVKREEIRTGEDGYVKMELTDGSVIILGPNSSIYIDEDMCEMARTLIRFSFGSLWTKVKKLIGGGKFEVSTERGCACVRGTEFSVETNSERDIVRVYEGTVEVKRNLDMKSMEQSGTAIQKLTEDYQAGKLTLEEYTAKVNEYSAGMNESMDNTSKETMVEAGFMVTVKDKVTSPEPIPSGESKWFEDPKIK